MGPYRAVLDQAASARRSLWQEFVDHPPNRAEIGRPIAVMIRVPASCSPPTGIVGDDHRVVDDAVMESKHWDTAAVVDAVRSNRGVGGAAHALDRTQHTGSGTEDGMDGLSDCTGSSPASIVGRRSHRTSSSGPTLGRCWPGAVVRGIVGTVVVAGASRGNS